MDLFPRLLCRDPVVRLVIGIDSVLRWSFHSQGRRVLHSPRILILSYDDGHRRVSAISFCLLYGWVSQMVAEEWLILEVQEWNGGQPRLCVRGTECMF